MALFSIEVEYIAANDAIKEGIWLSSLLGELEFDGENAVLFSDNQSAIYLSKNLMFHENKTY